MFQITFQMVALGCVSDDVSDTSFRSKIKGRKLTFIENRAFTSPLDRVVDVFQMCFRYVSDRMCALPFGDTKDIHLHAFHIKSVAGLFIDDGVLTSP